MYPPDEADHNAATDVVMLRSRVHVISALGQAESSEGGIDMIIRAKELSREKLMSCPPSSEKRRNGYTKKA
ncbi:hypothetical protein DY000_02060949 [Brassica cretica]|uniref:Uncharacterized protein n=1 Tax=Brassica cretica TaxID=69181 RepID=A0ABQ7AX10_BRACR|nr:hypothetical protein DY000_02060949 [Brassica cretica]